VSEDWSLSHFLTCGLTVKLPAEETVHAAEKKAHRGNKDPHRLPNNRDHKWKMILQLTDNSECENDSAEMEAVSMQNPAFPTLHMPSPK
ncbi:hypothetical protein ILYODFUR_016360, partial [Ilyodon furcidens]